ncbi:Calcium-dependent protein kinase 16 [Dichanthelium oligosanthes]|uniref:Calcium-dependent protein kinase 16 n=1 Tax=Dichanthelium oligosanthes TaxID=888268 RepID=A0A1E5V3K5_9POAL|nr:Calcium-dependent protein kinase 16 [Dichanthelium oligosanthes]
MGACFSSASAAPAGAAERRPSREGGKRRRGGAAPEGAANASAASAAPVRVEFGYERDFEARYEVGRLLGHGQFGYTFAATERQSGDRVAVKRIDKSKMTRPVAVEDVKREVKILKALKGHENIVHFYNAFEDDSYVYIVMELCEGGELLDRILAKLLCFSFARFILLLVAGTRSLLKGIFLWTEKIAVTNFLFKSNKEDSPLKATDFGLSDFIKPGKKFHDIVGSAYYVAPEVLKRRSGPESDVWSIGVITYILLCGRRPFWDKTEDGIFKEVSGQTFACHVLPCKICLVTVLRNKPDFRKRPWSSISSGAKDFVKRLLVKNPRARLTAAQALSHPWVREGGEASEIPVDISVLSNMRQFVKYSRFKQFALRALASTLNEEELADLKDQFDAIDIDKSGSISIEEMRHALAKDLPWRLKGPRVLEIIQAIDSNTDGLVDFKEFVAATLHIHQMAELDSERWGIRCQAAFSKFDLDGDGYITPEELRMRLAANPAAVLHAALLRAAAASSACRLPPHITFNSLLAAAASSPHPRLRALALPALALAHAGGRVPLDSYALSPVLRAAPSAAEMLHALTAKSGWLGSVFVACALAASYGGSGRFLDARRLFDESLTKNGVFGNAVLAAYVGAARWTQALGFTRRFLELRLQVNGCTMTAVVRACGEVANADLGVQAHGHAIRKLEGVEANVFLVSALVDMYAKCGLVHQAERVFGLAQQEDGGRGDVVLWTALLNAYGRHGQCKEVIRMYDLMVASGIYPDELAMLAVLSACQHAGEVTKGLKYFESMHEHYGLVPTPEHYGCVVNMLCQTGEVAKAWEIATKNGCDSAISVSTWGALLSACEDCGNVEVGRMAAQKAIEVEPANVGIYIKLSNLFARACLWEEIGQLRELMKEKGLEKDAGFTWVEQGS